MAIKMKEHPPDGQDRLNQDLEPRGQERMAALEAIITELRESEERYRLLFDRVPQAIWVFDLGTLAILAVNEAAVRHYGYSREEFLAMTIKDLRPAEDVPRLLDHLSKSSSELHRESSWRHRKKDGSVIDVEVYSHHLVFAGRQASLVVVNDITDLKRAEEKFRAVAETANDAIVSADTSGHITYFNRAAERIFGYRVDEVVGRPLTLLMPERFHEAHRQGLRRFLATGESHVIGKTVELAGRRKDGTEFPLELSLSTWMVAGEVAFTGLMRDITERKRYQEELRERSVQLEAANKELEAFAYSVSHDLRAPLRAIHGFSQALLQDCADKLDDIGRNYLQRVCRAAERMSALIDDLLNLSRVTRAEIQRETVDLSATAHTIARELEAREPHRSVEFNIAEGLVATGDPRLLGLALQNLLDNAWKFTAKRNRARIALGVEERNGRPTYFVRDNGAGFDMAYAGKMFGAFQRFHALTEFPGTGIGLATVQRIIHRHGGEIWAEGEVDKGATFYFTL
ncbi:MAG: PAS domain S-box protein [Acidobacteria bacterium]|nr:PAS domain S-box protein [Acidobacteriota bacterium]